jgi:mono/diheme cytochrome c family protein
MADFQIQPDGRGLIALAPPLDGSDRVTGPPGELIQIVLRGLDENPDYPEMPPLSGLTDEQLAAALTYIRQAWSNPAWAWYPMRQSRRPC